MRGTPEWASITGNAANATAIALRRCFRLEMSSIRPIIAAMKNTLIAARNGGSATSPRSFCRPTTRLREIENANRAAIPPSSATSSFKALFTSKTTMPPSFLLLIKGGVNTKTMAIDVRVVRIIPEPSPRSSGSVTTSAITSPIQVASTSTNTSVSRRPRHAARFALALTLVVWLATWLRSPFSGLKAGPWFSFAIQELTDCDGNGIEDSYDGRHVGDRTMGIRIHPTAEVSASASVGDGSSIWHWAQIRERSRIGRNCSIGKDVYIDADVVVGDECKIQNFATLYK